MKPKNSARLSLKLSPQLKARIRKHAAKQERSVHWTAKRLIQERLDQIDRRRHR
jgi:hypothetical protein